MLLEINQMPKSFLTHTAQVQTSPYIHPLMLREISHMSERFPMHTAQVWALPCTHNVMLLQMTMFINVLLHTSHRQGFCPVCRCWHCLISVGCLKTFLHTLYKFLCSPVCTHSCFLRWIVPSTLCYTHCLSMHVPHYICDDVAWYQSDVYKLSYTHCMHMDIPLYTHIDGTWKDYVHWTLLHMPHMYKHPLYATAHVSLHYSDYERPYSQTSHDMNVVHCVHEYVWWDYHIAWILQYVHHIRKGIPLYV